MEQNFKQGEWKCNCRNVCHRSIFKEERSFLSFFFLFALKIEFNTNFLFVYIVLIWKISGIIFLKYKEWNVIVERCITGQYLKRTDV